MSRVASLMSLVLLIVSAAEAQPERGGLWTGQVRARYQGSDGGVRSDLRVTIDVRLREYRMPLMAGIADARRVGTIVRFEPEGSVITNSFRCSGTNFTCRGDGTARVTIQLDENLQGHPSSMFIKDSEVDTSETLGYNYPTGAPMYSVWVVTRSEQTYQITYTGDGQSTTVDMNYLTPQLGWMWSTAGQTGTDPQVRRLESGAMRGSYRTGSSGVYRTMTASWSICREGTPCPPPPDDGDTDAPEPEDDCRESPLKAQMELNRAQRASKAAEMKKAWDRVVENQDVLDTNIEAWRAFVDACAIVDIIQQTVDAREISSAPPVSRISRTRRASWTQPFRTARPRAGWKGCARNFRTARTSTVISRKPPGSSSKPTRRCRD